MVGEQSRVGALRLRHSFTPPNADTEEGAREFVRGFVVAEGDELGVAEDGAGGSTLQILFQPRFRA